MTLLYLSNDEIPIDIHVKIREKKEKKEIFNVDIIMVYSYFSLDDVKCKHFRTTLTSVVLEENLHDYQQDNLYFLNSHEIEGHYYEYIKFPIKRRVHIKED